MSYTNIEDLPQLTDVESKRRSNGYMTQSHIMGEAGLDQSEMDRVGKVIRKPHNSPSQAGMMVNEGYRGPYSEQQGMQPQIVEQMAPVAMEPPQLHCIDVVNHASSCPICTKFYNNDRTVYIAIIIILIIICLLMLKKILNV